MLNADDVNIYSRVNTVHEALLLQVDLGRFNDLKLKLKLNLGKCELMRFVLIKNPITIAQAN